MAENPQNPPELNYYAMIQIGLEMAAPAGLGIWLDLTWGCLPWLTAVGAGLGLTLGLFEVTRIGGRNGKEKKSNDRTGNQLPRDDQP